MTKEIVRFVIHGLDETVIAIELPFKQHRLMRSRTNLVHYLIIIGPIGIQHLNSTRKSECGQP